MLQSCEGDRGGDFGWTTLESAIFAVKGCVDYLADARLRLRQQTKMSSLPQHTAAATKRWACFKTPQSQIPLAMQE